MGRALELTWNTKILIIAVINQGRRYIHFYSYGGSLSWKTKNSDGLYLNWWRRKPITHEIYNKEIAAVLSNIKNLPISIEFVVV